MSPQTIRAGDRVHDRDDADPNDAIVVNRPPLPASEWTVESRDCTLADDNPDYPEEASVVVVCFVEDLVEDGPPFDPTEQTALSLSTLNEAGVNFYTFPAPRLTVLESPATGIDGAETTTESEETDTGPSPELQHLKTTLEANDLTVTVEDAETLAVIRLGQTYYIRSDGRVEGDGALRAQLETIVQDAT